MASPPDIFTVCSYIKSFLSASKFGIATLQLGIVYYDDGANKKSLYGYKFIDPKWSNTVCALRAKDASITGSSTHPHQVTVWIEDTNGKTIDSTYVPNRVDIDGFMERIFDPVPVSTVSETDQLALYGQIIEDSVYQHEIKKLLGSFIRRIHAYGINITKYPDIEQKLTEYIKRDIDEIVHTGLIEYKLINTEPELDVHTEQLWLAINKLAGIIDTKMIDCDVTSGYF